MDDDEVMSTEGLATREDACSRPRSFSCVLLDSRSISDDNDYDYDDYDVTTAMEDMSLEQSKDIFDDDEFKRILDKKMEDRNEEETEVLLESMKHMMAFNNTSQSVKEELCSVMRFISCPKCDWPIIEDGAELEDWYMIVNGSVKVTQADGSIEILSVGQSFGICTNKEVTHQDGEVRTNEINCQFVCVLKDDFHAIFDKFEQNKINVDDNGRLVLVLERKVCEDNKDGYIVIQGSKEKLMTQLLDSNMADSTYIEDFLLTYRVFIDNPQEVTDALMKLFTDKSSREKVARVVLLWINNHFEDFDGCHLMLDFVDSFKGVLKHHKMFGHLKMLDITHSTHSYPRVLTFSRRDKGGDLPFSLIGGSERGIKGIFVLRVDKTSKLHDSGLRRGDEVLELNNRACKGLPMNEVMRIIRASTHLSIKVKSNFYGFEEACLRRDCQKSKTFDSSSSSSSSSSSKKFRTREEEDDGDTSSFVSSESEESKGTPKRTLSNFCRVLLNIGKQQQMFNETSGGDLMRKFRRKQSLALPSRLISRMSSSSDPDLSDLGSTHSLHNLSSLAALSQPGESGSIKPPDAVLKIFKADHTFKYIPVHKENTCKEVVTMAMKELGLTDPHSLCEVTFSPDGLTRTRALAEHTGDLSLRIPVNARYYLKSQTSPTFSFPDDIITSFLKESSYSFLELPAIDLAIQLTLRAFRLVKGIRTSDYICNVFDKHKSNVSKENIYKYAHLANEEFFWVVTEVCSEGNQARRSKVIKHFIRIAELCRLAQNYNSMFAITGGLGHGSVTRLKNTWEKLTPKCLRIFKELQESMDVSRNMSKYRNLLSTKNPDIPVVPFFPIFNKDLTFIHLGNDTEVSEGLINFEKMRMLAKELRNFNRLTKGSYMSSLDVFKPFKDLLNNGTEGWRKKGLQLLPKRLHEEGFQSRKAQTYLENLKVIYDETELDRLSQIQETSNRYLTTKKAMVQSSSTSNILNVDDAKEDKGEMNSTTGHNKRFIPHSFVHKTSKKLKVNPVIKKGSSLSSASSSSSSYVKHDLSVTPRWSSSSDNQSNDANKSSDIVDFPPPITLSIPVQHHGHLIVRPISHPPSKSQLAKKFPNFKPLLNCHQPYLNNESSSSSPFLQKLFLEPIYSPNSGGEEDNLNLEIQVPLRMTFNRNKRSQSSDRILERKGDCL